ncbi:MAG: hypothetical protein ACXAB7_21120, partial [Candidatus Kariarchaeaceae archaeon]
MKNKGIGVVLLIVTLSMLVVLPKNIAAIPTTILSDASTHNDVVIDGTIGNDWFDGNKTLTPDAYGDEAWGTNGDWGLNGLYFAINSSGLSVGLNASLAGNSNGFFVWFDIDKGATGSPLQHKVGDSTWERVADFENSFTPNYFFAAWGTANWALFNFTDSDGTKAWVDPALGYDVVTGNQTAAPVTSSIVHYEGFIEWALLYP